MRDERTGDPNDTSSEIPLPERERTGERSQASRSGEGTERPSRWTQLAYDLEQYGEPEDGRGEVY
jgi:hypothetical protein